MGVRATWVVVLAALSSGCPKALDPLEVEPTAPANTIIGSCTRTAADGSLESCRRFLGHAFFAGRGPGMCEGETYAAAPCATPERLGRCRVAPATPEEIEVSYYCAALDRAAAEADCVAREGRYLDDGGCARCGSDADCAGMRRCAPSGACVACLADADCGGATPACVDARCVACRPDAGCGVNQDCAGGACVARACDAAHPCDTGVCDDASARCVACTEDAHCPGQICDPASHSCVDVLPCDGRCSASELCVDDACLSRCDGVTPCASGACFEGACHPCRAADAACGALADPRCCAGQTCAATSSTTFACACVPSCGPASCGQPDGCGGTCTLCPGGQVCSVPRAMCEALCGNGRPDPGEACDTTVSATVTCGAADHGTIACDATCMFDRSGCGRCGNALRDGDEAGVDCGARVEALASCALCPVGETCGGPADCASGDCRQGRCADCADGVMNGSETGVDCGGACLQCLGGACVSDPDCVSNTCIGRLCTAPSCTDGRRNGTESDVDCGRDCPRRCGLGQQCLGDEDCIAGTPCSGGVCFL